MINGTNIKKKWIIFYPLISKWYIMFICFILEKKKRNIFGLSILINYCMTLCFLILRPTFRTAVTLILFLFNSRQSESNWRHIEDSLNRTMRLNANDSDGNVDKIRCHSQYRQNCKYGLEFKGFCSC